MENNKTTIELKRTDSSNLDFNQLIKSLDEYLAIINKEKDGFFKQFNTIDVLKHVVVLYKNKQAVACGAFKIYNDSSVEIKRMYVESHERDNGFASLVLRNLEQWAKILGYSKCILETSRGMEAALRLYENNNYKQTANYHPYIGQKSSCCFEKVL